MYLAKHGVLDSLTKVLAKIQEHQPENPLEVRNEISIILKNSNYLSVFKHSTVSQRELVNFTRVREQSPGVGREAQSKFDGKHAPKKRNRSLETAEILRWVLEV